MHINKVYDIRGDSDAFTFLFTLFFFRFTTLMQFLSILKRNQFVYGVSL